MIDKVFACGGGSPYIDGSGNEAYPLCGGSSITDSSGFLGTIIRNFLLFEILTIIAIIFAILVSMDVVKALLAKQKIGTKKLFLLFLLVVVSIIGIYLYINLKDIITQPAIY